MLIEPGQLEIRVADITTLHVDAIVNAANDYLQPGSGVCGAIHQAAGPELAQTCASIGRCEVGEAKITPGYDLPSKFVIHAVGPRYLDGQQGEPEQLVSCYQRSLELAGKNGIRSIAFPSISTGVFGYPLQEAAEIALNTIGAWLNGSRLPHRIICCCFSLDDAEIYRQLYSS